MYHQKSDTYNCPNGWHKKMMLKIKFAQPASVQFMLNCHEKNNQWYAFKYKQIKISDR